MNEIVYVGEFENTRKYFTIIESNNCFLAVPKNKIGSLSQLLGHRSICIKNPVTSIKTTYEIKKYRTQIAALFDMTANVGDSVLRAIGGTIMAYINEESKPEYSPIIAQVIQKIEDNLHDTYFSLEQYLSTLPLNSEYIRKLFKKEIGISARDYMTQRKVERAKNMIESGIANKYSKYSVLQIAQTCGFSDALYFSRVFKKLTGYSPLEYMNK